MGLRGPHANNTYMVVTGDELELPLCVGTANEVAEYLGKTAQQVHVAVCKGSLTRYGPRNERARVYKVDSDDSRQIREA